MVSIYCFLFDSVKVFLAGNAFLCDGKNGL